MSEAEIKDFFYRQLESWDLVRMNYEILNQVKKKPFQTGTLKGWVQFNPGRKSSTMANLDHQSLEKRKCFLCKNNRPKEQIELEIIPGWDLVVNPFPILPYHFTIVNKKHIDQKLVFETGEILADKMEGFTVFFNDNGAGASAPDHMHFQAVPIKSLPLIQEFLSEEQQNKKIDLPFKILTEEQEIRKVVFPVNVFFWKNEKGIIKKLGIPRQAHRPKEFYLEYPKRRAVSPGAIDMAGIIVTPYEEDFNSLNNEEIKEIYLQVGISND